MSQHPSPNTSNLTVMIAKSKGFIARLLGILHLVTFPPERFDQMPPLWRFFQTYILKSSIRLDARIDRRGRLPEYPAMLVI